MKKYIIDTNVLISYVTDRNLEQQRKVAPLFESASHLKASILCHQLVLTEFVYVMDKVYHVPKNEIRCMMIDLIEMPGVEIVHDVDLIAALACWPDPIPYFGDAVIASICMSRKPSEIITFDRKFRNGLKSLEINLHPVD